MADVAARHGIEVCQIVAPDQCRRRIHRGAHVGRDLPQHRDGRARRHGLNTGARFSRKAAIASALSSEVESAFVWPCSNR